MIEREPELPNNLDAYYGSWPRNVLEATLEDFDKNIAAIEAKIAEQVEILERFQAHKQVVENLIRPEEL